MPHRAAGQPQEVTMTSTARKSAPFIFIVGTPNLWAGAMSGNAVALAALEKSDAVATPAPYYGTKPAAAKAEDNDPESVAARADWAAHMAATRHDAEQAAKAVCLSVLKAHTSGRSVHVVVAHGATGNGDGYATVAAPKSVQGFVLALVSNGATLTVLPAIDKAGAQDF